VSHNSPSILVVDDDPSVRSLLIDVLETEGYAVRAAADGFAALRSVADAAPDCVVLDVMMPGLDGHEVLGALRNRVESRRVPVVMLTAAADDEDVWRAWSGGVDYYLSKPFAPEELLRFLRYLLAGPDPMAVGPA
jgi:DNA-binding response OmpR family regulator